MNIDYRTAADLFEMLRVQSLYSDFKSGFQVERNDNNDIVVRTVSVFRFNGHDEDVIMLQPGRDNHYNITEDEYLLLCLGDYKVLHKKLSPWKNPASK